ncbi:MAG: TonB-dependent receptor [Bacteroidia bacterium]|nr:TonB-dependent receptor [Bacteroidia bacterium]
MKNILSASIIFMLSLPLTAQLSRQIDTIKISEVVINSKKLTRELPGFKKSNIDSSLLQKYNLRSLEDLFSENSLIYIKSYGPGGSATPSFRGTGAAHTQVTWNGININHPMLGQSDFSLIPSGMVDDVKISYGGASMEISSGGIGGSINLESKPDWTKQTIVNVNAGAGSFDSYSGFVKVNTGSEHFQTVTKAFLQSSQNDFPYLSTNGGSGSARVKRENSEILQKGLMEELYFKIDEDVLSSRFWYQSASRNLPGSILYGEPVSGEKQYDESFRSMVNYDHYGTKYDFFITGAHLFSMLNYSYPMYAIESKSQTESFVFKGGLTSHLDNRTDLKIVIDDEFTGVESNNYDKDIDRNIASLTLSAERKQGERFGTILLLRETINNSKVLIPDFSAGFQYRFIKSKNHFLKLNIARNSKIPSLNDCYWIPGGNPDLKNEYAYTCEVGYKTDLKISKLVEFASEVSFFKSYIRDMILWHQGESYFWIAENISSVNNSGIESMVSAKYSVRDLKLNFNAGYSYTKAVSKDSLTMDKRLIYVPEHQINGSLQVGYKALYSVWITDFTGKRFTTSDNSDYFPGYTVNSLLTGFRINLKQNIIDLNFKIKNIFNISYEGIAGYPQPGRSFYITLLFQIKK